MKTQQQGSAHILLAVLAVIVIAGGVGYFWYQNQAKPASDSTKPQPTVSQSPEAQKPVDATSYKSLKGVEITVYQPVSDQVVASPVQVVGKVPGNWSSEAVFPVELTDANGKSIASGQATLQGDWMTDKLVPFTASLKYDKAPSTSTGYLVLKKDNPSGMAEKDDSLKLPVKFAD